MKQDPKLSDLLSMARSLSPLLFQYVSQLQLKDPQLAEIGRVAAKVTEAQLHEDFQRMTSEHPEMRETLLHNLARWVVRHMRAICQTGKG